MENQRIVAGSIFSSALCPLNCKYCYIPKTDTMRKLQNEIIDKFKNKTFVRSLKKTYGQNLEHLSLWGAEPTLNLNLIGKTIIELTKTFPKLRGISFSTSLMTNPNLIFNFIQILDKTGKKIKFDCQISLDGPNFISDTNRIKGASQKVPENFFYLIKELNKLNLKNVDIFFNFKPTLTLENIKLLNKNKIKEYFYFFEKIFQRYKKLNKNKKINLTCSSSPSLTLPGKYTSSDGKVLAIFFKNLREIAKKNKKNNYWQHTQKTLNLYVKRFERLINYQKYIFIKPQMFTCSGGDSHFGLGIKNDLHICHRTFFLNSEEYTRSILNQKNIDNWDISLLQKGNIDLVNKQYITDIKNEKNKIRIFYILRNHHDFTRLKNSYIVSMLKELALAKQADKEFLKNNELCLVFAIFINSALNCPTESLLNTGTTHFIPISLIRLFANGAFLEILKDHYENFPRREQ